QRGDEKSLKVAGRPADEEECTDASCCGYCLLHARKPETPLIERRLIFWGQDRRSEPEAAHAALSPAQVVCELMPHRALDLRAQEVGVAPEVALERVLVDDDAVRIGVASHRGTDVVPVGAFLAAAIGNDDGRPLKQLAK